MSDVLPIIEGLRDCRTHAERETWLCACPYGVIARDHLVIDRILSDAGFSAGVAYLGALVAAISSTRLADGSLPEMRRFSIHLARTDMAIAARNAET